MNEAGFNPMLEPMVEKPYTQEFVDTITQGVEVNEQSLPEAEYKYVKPPVEEPVVEAKDVPPATPPNPQFQAMSVTEQRSNSEKSADALIQTYAQIAPVPFIMMSQFNMRKVNKLHKKGEIDLSMVVTPDGKTIENYMNGHNEQVQELFTVDEDTCESIKEPLIDVLMEKQIVLTPMQRLGFAIGNHLASFSKKAFELYMSKADDMEQFREFREKQIQLQREGLAKNNRPVTVNNPSPIPPEFEPEEILTETNPVKESITDKMVKPPVSVNTDEPEMSLADYMNAEVNLSSITNDDSITITEEEAEPVN